MVASTCPECRGALDTCPHGDGRGRSIWPHLLGALVVYGIPMLAWLLWTVTR